MGIAVFGEPTRSAEWPRLLRAEIQAAELQALAVMWEPTQVAGFRQDREGRLGLTSGNVRSR